MIVFNSIYVWNILIAFPSFRHTGQFFSVFAQSSHTHTCPFIKNINQIIWIFCSMIFHSTQMSSLQVPQPTKTVERGFSKQIIHFVSSWTFLFAISTTKASSFFSCNTVTNKRLLNTTLLCEKSCKKNKEWKIGLWLFQCF